MQNIWVELLDYARWTPTPHNVQSWKVKIISDSHAELFYEPKRLLPVTDPAGAFCTIGLAMFVDTLKLAANKHKLDINVTYEKKPFDFNSPSPVLFAKLELIPTTKVENLDRELIKNRRTSRLPYKNQAVSEELIKKFQAETEVFGHHFNASSNEEMVNWVMDLNKETLFYDLGEDQARKEIGALLRYTNKQAEATKDGLWSYCFNIPGWFMKIFFDYEKFFELPVVKQILLSFYGRTMRGTKTVAWMQGPFRKFDDYINAGYAFNRLWLKMAEQNVYLHPFGSVITNPNAHLRLKEKFKVDEEKELLWLLLRIGYSEVPPRSLRLDINDILIK